MVKAVKTSPKAAYETFPGISAEEAAEKGYVIVETDGNGAAPVYGRYLNTVTGAAMEVLADKDDREATPAGGLAAAARTVSADKGALINPNDPIVHGQADKNPHEDGAAPLDSQNAGLELEGYDPLAPEPEHTTKKRK